MRNTTITFGPDEIVELATFCAQLIREAVGFEVNRDKHGSEVVLTGGF